MTHRDLSVRTYPEFDRGLPVNPTHWTEAELATQKTTLLARPGVHAERLEHRWDQMLQARHERLALEVPYAARDLPPPEVVQEVPLQWLAQRAWSRAPQVALLGHALAETCGAIAAVPGKASRPQAATVGGWLTRRARRQHYSWRDNALYLVGGLSLVVLQGRLYVSFGGVVLAEGPAVLAQGPHLRRLLVQWARLVREAVASELRLALPTGASLSTPAELALPVHGKPSYANAYVMERGSLVCAHRTLIHDTNHFADREARHALAATMIRQGVSRPDFGKSLQALLVHHIFGGCPVQRLRPAAPVVGSSMHLAA